MPPRKLTKLERLLLPFDECENCLFVFTRKCRACDFGENFEDADTPVDTAEFMNREMGYGYE